MKVVETLDADVIAGAVELAAMPVPDRKGEVAQEVARGLLPPFLIGGEDQVRIRDGLLVR